MKASDNFDALMVNDKPHPDARALLARINAEQSPDPTCMLPDVDACCCTCRWRVPTHGHPCTDGKSISEQTGWACVQPEFGVVFPGWSEHGMCECHDEIEASS